MEHDRVRETIADAIHDGLTLLGYGRRQHGLRGKDADLDPGGQIVIESVFVTDLPTEGLFIGADVLCVANICAPYSPGPDSESIKEEIVVTWDYPGGEWTGSDYWQFLCRAVVTAPLFDAEYDDCDGVAAGKEPPEILSRVAERLHEAIRSHPDVTGFTESMSALDAALAAAE